MNKNNKKSQKILIVDDSEMNRAILSAILGNEYEIIEAENGAEAVAILQKCSVEISLVLLDIVMPVMDGYEVLAVMNSNHWIEDVPVIMISAENSPSYINRAYDLGVIDFISRPFDARVVCRRAQNIILLYAKQKKLAGMVADQIYEKEKNSSLMIAILSHIVEFRNGESGLHVLHVQELTEILLKTLLHKTDRYKLSASDITMISKASALHDIGKISIPSAILNKPGRLTNEEFEIMKTHSAVGASMIKELGVYQDEPLIKFAYEICRWHHERYDGRGYPDGLKGDEIPISAQIVSLADVYDALTSDRVYKKAYSHDVAMNMIFNGECGAFNPFLLDCLKDAEEVIKKGATENFSERYKEMKNIADEMLNHDEFAATERTLHMLEYERTKNNFLTNMSRDIVFEYTAMPSMLSLSPYGAGELGLKETIIDPFDDDELRSVIDAADMERIASMVRDATPQQPVTKYSCPINFKGKKQNIQIICRSMWINDEYSQFTGVIGKLENIDFD